MKLNKYVFGLFLIFSFSSAWAAEATTPPLQVDQIEIDAEQSDSALDVAVDEALEEELEADEAERSPSRVVPTEQISQDLGVSFPVDI